MEELMVLTGRHLKVYLRDRSAVFFSLLSAMIIIGLMAFFLGDMNIDAILEVAGPFATAGDELETLANNLVLTWTFAGILSINAVSVSISVYSGMIRDRVSGKLNSIYTAPISRLKITLSYILAAWAAAVLICLLSLGVMELYGVMQGMELYSLKEHIQIVAMIIGNSFVYAAMMYALAMIAKTEGAWGGFGTVIGTLVGFLGGIYLPIGTLSDGIAAMMKCTPIIYGTAAFREVMTKGILEQTFAGVPEMITKEYQKAMGICLTVGDYTLKMRDEWLILISCGIIFLLVGIGMLKYSKKTDR